MDCRKAIVTVDDVNALESAFASYEFSELKKARAVIERLRKTFESYEPEKFQRAWEKYHRDGEIEIDEGAVCSRGDDPGCYVQAWVWCYDDEGEE
jgi:hypothetical protein